MADKHVLLFTTVANFFKNDMNQLQRGENSYRSGNVESMIFDNDLKPAILKGKVSASMKKKTYSVEVEVDIDNEFILTAKCTCPRGLAVCHHMAALCIYAHHNVSVTDKVCSWAAPSTSAVGDIVTIADLFPKSKMYEAITEEVPDTNIENFVEKLGTSNTVGFTWLLKPDRSIEMNNLLPYIEDLVFSAEYMVAPDKKHFMLSKCQLTAGQIHEICLKTVGQSKNENWLIARKHRLTASNFGVVLAAVRRERYPPSLFKRLLDGYDLSSVLAVQWGKEHEAAAIADFNSAYSTHQVVPTGLWLQSNGFLGASPDGLYGDSAIVEVKCPYKYRNCSSLTDVLTNDRTYIIYKHEGNTFLNVNHEYYDQIQGQLHITNREICYLVIWTPIQVEIVEVIKDESWENNLSILLSFYMDYFLPYISNMK